jgi:hypothetical protein
MSFLTAVSELFTLIEQMEKKIDWECKLIFVADVEPTFDSCGLSTFLKISL